MPACEDFASFLENKSLTQDGLPKEWQQEVKSLKTECRVLRRSSLEDGVKLKEFTKEAEQFQAHNEQMLKELRGLRKTLESDKVRIAMKTAKLTKTKEALEAATREKECLRSRAEALQRQFEDTVRMKPHHEEAIRMAGVALMEMYKKHKELRSTEEALQRQIDALQRQVKAKEEEVYSMQVHNKHLLEDLDKCIFHMEHPAKLRESLLAVHSKYVVETGKKGILRRSDASKEALLINECKGLLDYQNRNHREMVKKKRSENEEIERTIKSLKRKSLELKKNYYLSEEKLYAVTKELIKYKRQEDKERAAQSLAEKEGANCFARRRQTASSIPAKAESLVCSLPSITLNGKQLSLNCKTGARNARQWNLPEGENRNPVYPKLCSQSARKGIKK